MYNVLLVDDSKTIRAVIAKTLNIAGVEVSNLFEAADGSQALELLRNEWIDIVFADINMPVMTGIEMVEVMEREGMLANIPVVIVSTEGSIERIEQLKSIGVKAYLRKPFSPEELKEVVDKLLIGKG
jgi:two-component system, chemotaxis family, chemotaxis protein CheY